MRQVISGGHPHLVGYDAKQRAENHQDDCSANEAHEKDDSDPRDYGRETANNGRGKIREPTGGCTDKPSLNNTPDLASQRTAEHAAAHHEHNAQAKNEEVDPTTNNASYGTDGREDRLESIEEC